MLYNYSTLNVLRFMGMKRSALLASVTLMQLLLGVLFSGICIFLLSLIPEVIPGRNAAAAIWGLKFAAAIIGPLALLVLASLYGVWKGKLWGLVARLCRGCSVGRHSCL